MAVPAAPNRVAWFDHKRFVELSFIYKPNMYKFMLNAASGKRLQATWPFRLQGDGESRSTIRVLPVLSFKTLLTMKLMLLFLLTGLFSAQAEGLSQTITYSGRNVAITKVFAAIESQTGYSVFANKELLRDSKPVTLTVKEMPLQQFLQQMFQDQPLDFEVNNKTIFLKKKKQLLHKIAAALEENVPPPPPTITGIVLDSAGNALPGASVIVKGTTVSTTTNGEGRFTIEAETNQTLVISYIGYKTLEVALAGRTTISVQLEKQVNEIEQVVVTALGIPRKTKALTYNVQEVKGDEVLLVRDASFINSLNGKVAGITINSSASGIGGSARVVMRGTKSLLGNNNALFVIDGIPLPSLQTTQASDIFTGSGGSGDGISNINPDDIETMSVLTGPAAAALYGSQAANGVVVITTKKGTPGKLEVSVSNNTNFYSPAILPEFQNRYGSPTGSYFSWGDKLATPSSYKPKDFFQTGLNVTNSVSVSTGTEKNQTYFSAASVAAKGIITNNELDRLNFSFRNTAQLLDNKLTWDLNAMYINTEEQNMLTQGQYFNPMIPIYLFPVSDDIERYKVYERFDPARNFNTQFWPYGDQGFQMQNPYWIMHRNMFQNKKNRFIVGTGLKYKINEWLDVAGRVRLDQNNTVAERKFYASTAGLFASDAGAYYKNNEVTRQLYADLLLNVNKQLSSDLNLSGTLGTSLLDVQYSTDLYGGNLLTVPNLFAYSNVNQTQATVSQSRFRDQVQGVFGTAQLAYRNMVFVEATARTDWSSALANTKSNSVFYPSVGASAVLTDLLKYRSQILSFAKIRASYSEVGNAPQRFVTVATHPIIGGFPTTTSFRPANSLRPERTKSYELGLNLRFLRNRINLDVTLYQSNTFNQLFNPMLAPSTGFSSFYINAGEVSNKGIEVALGGSVKLGAVDWTPSVTFTLNRNNIRELLASYEDELTNGVVKIDEVNVGGTGSYISRLVTGGSMGDIYVNTLATDEHGFIKVGLVSQTVQAETNNYIKAGNANPRYNLGFRNSFAYKDFQLNLLVTARIGGEVVSVTQAIMDRFGVSEASADARDAGGVVINGQKIPAQPYYEVAGGGVAGVGSRYVYSASNLRLAEAALNYTLPARWFGNTIKGATVGVNGRNLLLFTKAPFDPELAASTGTFYQGIDYFMQPSLRTVGFNVRVKF